MILAESEWRKRARTEKDLTLPLMKLATVTEFDRELAQAAADEGSRSLTFVISSEMPDRYNDVIRVDGWELKDFEANPVVLWAHSRWDLPIGSVEKLWVEDKKLKATVTFAPAEANAFADAVFRLLILGHLRASSVGFKPLEWTYDEERDGYTFIRQTLLELSICTIPANPEALLETKGGDPLLRWYQKAFVEGAANPPAKRAAAVSATPEPKRMAETARRASGLYFPVGVCCHCGESHQVAVRSLPRAPERFFGSCPKTDAPLMFEEPRLAGAKTLEEATDPAGPQRASEPNTETVEAAKEETTVADVDAEGLVACIDFLVEESLKARMTATTGVIFPN